MIPLRDSHRRLDTIPKSRPEGENNVITTLMNTRVFGIWRYEEKCYYLPFEDGKPFELCIYVHHKEYKVMVNGQRIYNFAHRFPPASVKMLQVLKDISLTRVLISD
ncbi:placental protein 13-like [Pongo pygmaeus]|uniref:placental protein 13-like n=1 Tax=Pongo pygmaeus TaxID=9600 RepID=UPI00300D756B